MTKITTYYRVWCEWDIGLNDVIFATREGAWAVIHERLVSCGVIEYDLDCLHALEEDGLVGLEMVTVSP